jgi:hypothetical protein
VRQLYKLFVAEYGLRRHARIVVRIASGCDIASRRGLVREPRPKALGGARWATASKQGG